MPFTAVFLWYFLTILVPLTAHADDCRGPDSQIKSGIVKVKGDSAAGSGVVIAPGLVLTAAHVIEGMDDIDVVVQREAHDAKVISSDRRIDLALLSVDTRNIKPLPLRHRPLSKQSTVWALGYAFGKHLQSGRGKYRTEANRLIYTSAPVNFGQSGGGLLSCENGHLVLTGIIRAFGAEKKNGKLVRRDDISVATRPDDTRQFISSASLSIN